ncbi:MAG: cache domain-containing protein [Granulosicoccus sp.]
MFINKCISSAFFTTLLLFGSTSMASDFGTAEEARSMLERAVTAMEKDKTTALIAFTEGSNGFKDRDLYVACFTQGTDEGVLTAHGGVAELVGTSGYDLIDKQGTNMGELLNHDTKGEFRTATYWWPRPGSTEAVEKESFYTTIGDQNCLVGYYK